MKTGLCGKQRPAARSGVAPGTVRATVLPVYHHSRFKARVPFGQFSLRERTESTVCGPHHDDCVGRVYGSAHNHCSHRAADGRPGNFWSPVRVGSETT